MSVLTRKYEETIKYWLGQNKVIILYGARQVGKSTIFKFVAKVNGWLCGA